jgi:hypothetical protein
MALLLFSGLLRLPSVHHKTVRGISIKSARKWLFIHLQWTRAVDVSVLDILSYLGEKKLYLLCAPTELLCPKS